MVLHDDVDLPLGRIRLRESGSAGGHRGIASIIQSLQTDRFSRLKIGVGRPPAGQATEDHVLRRFGRAERALLSKALEKSAAAAESVILEGLNKTMSLFNAAP